MYVLKMCYVIFFPFEIYSLYFISLILKSDFIHFPQGYATLHSTTHIICSRK